MSPSDCHSYVSSGLVTQTSQDSYKTGWQMRYLVSTIMQGRAGQDREAGRATAPCLFSFALQVDIRTQMEADYYCILTQDNRQGSAGQISQPLTVLLLDSTGNQTCSRNLHLYPKFFAWFAETWPQRSCYKPCRLQWTYKKEFMTTPYGYGNDWQTSNPAGQPSGENRAGNQGKWLFLCCFSCALQMDIHTWMEQEL